MITFEVTGVTEFKNYLEGVRSRFSTMVQTMIDVGEVIHAETLPLTPYLTGELGESYKLRVIENTSQFIEVEISMSAVDSVTGFNYALYQHEEDLYHPSPRAGQKQYLLQGIYNSENMFYEIIGQDYLSLWGR